ncbi:MAG: fibronectin type III domain-containing protein [Candidatus Latescibacteria bacterium]|nr:fibronectin type III domain-containing protein [Candidatus Latescibacterota bacterium]
MNRQKAFFLVVLFIIFLPRVGAAVGQNTPPAPATQVRAFDTPNDAGGSITITWKKSADDGQGENDVVGYEILRSTASGSGYQKVASVLPGEEGYTDGTVEDNVAYYYVVRAVDGQFSTDSVETGPAMAKAQWFNTDRTSMLVAVLIFSGLVLWFISQAKGGRQLYIRPIPGLAAIDEAVGRATEMGKPVLFIPGIMDMDNIQTIAGITILRRVARKAAEYETPLLVPTSRSLVMTTAQEAVKEAYLDAGRPDAYDPDRIRYLTDNQFGYAAGVDGIMVREKPAAIFYMGCFYAESLILAETGHSVGAIQIAGTAMPAQLPFFVTACDYTLIGEELFAASAYLSREPRLLGSLKGQDFGKAIFMIIIVVGIILESFGIHFLSQWLATG